MARINWPATSGAYRFNISNLRMRLDEVYDWLRKSPKAKTEVQNQIKTFAVKAGLNLNASSGTQAVVSNAQELTGVAPTGTYISKVTFTVAGGAITAIVLS